MVWTCQTCLPYSSHSFVLFASIIICCQTIRLMPELLLFISLKESEQIKNALMMGLASEKTPLPSISRKDSDKSSSLDEELEHRRSSFQSEVESQSNFLELGTPRVINAVKLNINLEAGSLLPLALR